MTVGDKLRRQVLPIYSSKGKANKIIEALLNSWFLERRATPKFKHELRDTMGPIIMPMMEHILDAELDELVADGHVRHLPSKVSTDWAREFSFESVQAAYKDKAPFTWQLLHNLAGDTRGGLQPDVEHEHEVGDQVMAGDTLFEDDEAEEGRNGNDSEAKEEQDGCRKHERNSKGEEGNEEVEGSSMAEMSDEDEEGDTSGDDEGPVLKQEDEASTHQRRYGRTLAVPRTSSSLNVAARVKLEEERILEVEKIDKAVRNREAAFPKWIQFKETRLHDSPGAIRYGRLGVVGRAAYDIAELEAMNRVYKEVIAETLDRQKRNEQLMRELEEARVLALENDRLYAEALAKYREGSARVSESRQASMRKDTFTRSYIDMAPEKRSKKRRQMELPETPLFGRKGDKTAKKSRTNSSMLGGV